MTQPNTIRTLSDSALLKRLNVLAEKERATTLEILLHLNEVDRRRLYLTQGYSSLFSYCTEHLKYSESAAGRRIRTARCMGRYPEVRRLLARNDVNVCTISIVAGILTKENKKTLLREIRGKTQRQVHVIASGYRPERTIRDRVRPVAVIKPTRAHTPSTTSPNNASTDDVVRSRAFEKWQEIYRRSGGKKLTTAAGVPLGSAEGGTATRLDVTDGGEATPVKTECVAANESTFIIEQQFELGFAVSAEFMKKLDEVKALLSNRYPAGIEFEQLFEAVIDDFIDRHSPKRKQARREQRKQQHDAAKGKKGPSRSNDKTAGKRAGENSTNKRTRYVSSATKDIVYTRDGGRCTFVGKNGKRCNALWGLQIDHIEPHARGGSNRASNLRLLCGKHNRIEAERILGVGIGARRNPGHDSRRE
jgi:5-methylcytosine-specific restriction endonuclease McrA